MDTRIEETAVQCECGRLACWGVGLYDTEGVWHPMCTECFDAAVDAAAEAQGIFGQVTVRECEFPYGEFQNGAQWSDPDWPYV